jgi:hypothetical protein
MYAVIFCRERMARKFAINIIFRASEMWGGVKCSNANVKSVAFPSLKIFPVPHIRKYIAPIEALLLDFNKFAAMHQLFIGMRTGEYRSKISLVKSKTPFPL